MSTTHGGGSTLHLANFKQVEDVNYFSRRYQWIEPQFSVSVADITYPTTDYTWKIKFFSHEKCFIEQFAEQTRETQACYIRRFVLTFRKK